MVLSRSSKDAADPLSEVVTVLGGRSARVTRLEASGDWALRFPAQARLKFVALLRGDCVILLPDRQPRTMSEGDVFLIGDTAYTVASAPGIEPVDGTPLYRESGHDVVRLNGDDTVLLGGGIAFNEISVGFMLDALPVVLRIGWASPSAGAVYRTLELLDAAVADGRPGASLVTMRLADVLLVEAIRAHIADQGDSCIGWIGALADRQIGAALRLMHGEIDRPWTVGSLAAQVGMSRSAFSSRFSSRVGRPPLDYLTRWRMLVARRLLDAEHADVARIASAVGYTSQSAFGHAYKRMFGHSPR